jgi:DNA polymerase III subunit gamma/tau
VITVGAVAPEPASAPGAAAPTPPPASIAAAEAAERQARTARVKDAARNHPNIREAASILDGSVDKIEEL